MTGTSALASLLLAVTLALCLGTLRGASAAGCADFTNCTTCAAVAGCGWCPAQAACLNGTAFNQSADGSCDVTHDGWHVNMTDCRNCSAYTDCKSCVEAFASVNGSSSCGWCESFSTNGTGNGTVINATCWEGNSAGPFRKAMPGVETCAAKDWGFSVDFCGDDSSSEKRKLAIIIGLSVAGGLFVLAVAATIVFVIIKRAQRSRGYQAINESA